MEDQGSLDKVEETKNTKYGNLSFKTLIAVFVFIFILILMTFISSVPQFILIFIGLGPAFSNLMGIGFSIMSLVKGEPNTTYKLVGIIGHFTIIFVLMGVYGFIYVDLMTIPPTG